MRALWLSLALCSLVSVAHAQDAPTEAPAPSDPTAEARTAFSDAVALGDQDRWAEALELFRRSLALVPRPSTRFNVGFALFRLGRFGEAIENFDAYLAATEGETSDLRTEAQRRRAEALANLAELEVVLDPPDATLAVDDVPDASTGASRTLTLDPGRHVLSATAAGRLDLREEVSLALGEHRRQALTLAMPIADGHEEGESVVEDPVFWIVTAAIVVVGVGVGVGVGVAASQPPAPYGGTTGVVLTMP
jgi:tetratricopeptide (TPR) repeat protein